MEHGIELRGRTVQIYEADAHVLDGCVRLQRANTLDDECLESLDECEIMHPGPVIVACQVTTHIVDDDIDGFETCAATTCLLGRFDCSREDGTANPAGIGETLELGCDGAKVAADVVSRIELSPFFERGRVLRVKAF